jgi:hypothetical protein
MDILSVVLVVIVLLGLAFFGLAIQVIFKKSHEFPNTHVGANINLKTQGITCAQTWDKIEQREGRKKIQFENLKLSKDQ